jgi:hypothetical protein
MLLPSPRSCLRVALFATFSLSVACDAETDPVTEPEPDPVTPITLACAAPALLDGTPDWSDPRFIGFIVTYHDGIDPHVETARLSARYGFTPRFIYRYALLGFAARLTPETLNAIRCEPSVRRVSVDYWSNVLAAQYRPLVQG